MSDTKTKQHKSETPEATETHEFKAEVSRLLDILIHSVYSEREVFLRELVSNASDACDKLRYSALTDPDLIKEDPELKISIQADDQAKTLTVADNGIGMSHDELAENLGTLARSGTRAFMAEANAAEGDDKAALIGQFGIGFYSAFMVADHVEVVSRRAGAEAAWLWRSDGTGSYEIAEAGEDAPARGTRIVLHMRDNAEEFLDGNRIRAIIKTYSDHVPLPIELAETDKEKGHVDVSVLNAARALWTRPKSEISAEDYKEFYGHITGLYDDPAHIIHYRAEGRHEYGVMLFVPKSRPFDLFDPDRKGRIKLYVRRVLITDEADMLPAYLRFVRGVVDSEDMPLTVSREMLQNNPVAASIRKALTKRVLSELEKMAEKQPEDFAALWEAFGAVIKEGLYEDYERRDELLKLSRFKTTAEGEELRSLKDYVGAMAENQTAIYYITGESADQIAASPQLEGFRARGVEVLLLSDPVDSFWTATASGYDGKPFVSITQGAADLSNIPLKEGEDGEDGKADEAGKASRKTGAASLAALIKTHLEGEIEDVRLSDRLIDSPVCLVAGSGGPDLGLEKILRQSKGEQAEVLRVLEINPEHDMIQALAGKAEGDEALMADMAHLLLDQARIIEGEVPADPAAFSRRLDSLIIKGLG
ncbi:MAG: molecular chaperone HtpG [Hyphomicrobiales bacterium]|nr:MAG: molecular chaperone HtpG [Hyphomicrobiales bacterium]